MELLTLIVSFLLAISFLLPPCASDQLNLQKPLQQGDDEKFAQPSLPRKLNLNHEASDQVKSSAEEYFTRSDKFRQASLGTKQHGKEENVINAAEIETLKSEGLKEEEEIPNKSEYFTMDYGWVKRRRPIHNKQIPFVP